MISRFEQKLCEVTGVKYAVAVANGTAALHLACLAAGISEGDEVITTPMTFAATANSVLYCGGKPVFCDIDEKTWNIDPRKIEKLITNRTKAIIPVHYMGSTCDMTSILEIAKDNNLIVIEDGAHAIGSCYEGNNIGSIGHMTTFSFHPVKTVTTGEGGAITTNDEELYHRLMKLRTHGIERSPVISEANGEWYYNQSCLGFNYRITDIQCALGITQLDKLESFVEKRKEICLYYDNEISNLSSLIRPIISSESVQHIYVIQLIKGLDKYRREIFDELRRRDIGVNVHYIPVYYHTYYQDLGYSKGICPIAEDLYNGIITMPMYPHLTQTEQKYVIEQLKDVLNKFEKQIVNEF